MLSLIITTKYVKNSNVALFELQVQSIFTYLFAKLSFQTQIKKMLALNSTDNFKDITILMISIYAIIKFCDGLADFICN